MTTAVGDYVALGDQPGRVTKCEAGKVAVQLMEGGKTLWRPAKDVVPLLGVSGTAKTVLDSGDWVHVVVKPGEAAVLGQLARKADGGRVNVRLPDGRTLWRGFADLTPPSDDAPKTILLGASGTPQPARASAASAPAAAAFTVTPSAAPGVSTGLAPPAAPSTAAAPSAAAAPAASTTSVAAGGPEVGFGAAFGVALRSSSVEPASAAGTPRSTSLASRIAQQRQERAAERAGVLASTPRGSTPRGPTPRGNTAVSTAAAPLAAAPATAAHPAAAPTAAAAAPTATAAAPTATAAAPPPATGPCCTLCRRPVAKGEEWDLATSGLASRYEGLDPHP